MRIGYQNLDRDFDLFYDEVPFWEGDSSGLQTIVLREHERPHRQNSAFTEFMTATRTSLNCKPGSC